MKGRIALALSIVLTGSVAFSSPGLAAGRAYVRVNQVGYVSDAPKQAFLLSTADHAGETFDLSTKGIVVAVERL